MSPADSLARLSRYSTAFCTISCRAGVVPGTLVERVVHLEHERARQVADVREPALGACPGLSGLRRLPQHRADASDDGRRESRGYREGRRVALDEASGHVRRVVRSRAATG